MAAPRPSIPRTSGGERGLVSQRAQGPLGCEQHPSELHPAFCPHSVSAFGSPCSSSSPSALYLPGSRAPGWGAGRFLLCVDSVPLLVATTLLSWEGWEEGLGWGHLALRARVPLRHLKAPQTHQSDPWFVRAPDSVSTKSSIRLSLGLLGTPYTDSPQPTDMW